MKVKLFNQLIILCFFFLGINNVTAQIDCNCDFTIDPVCVITLNGDITTFPNACLAECEGYGEDAIVACEPDCVCPDIYEPVCVLTGTGVICPFANWCLAECAGYTAGDLVDCDGDCVCTGEYDPVCVITNDGLTFEFSNPCWAACAGYGPDSYVSCNAGNCTAIIIASQVDDEGFVWAFGSITSGNVVSYEWTFGDGNTSTEAAPVHTYTTPGLYLVSLTISTADGCTATATHLLYDGNCYNIIIAIPSGNATYAFGSIANSIVLSYFWEFGDGETSSDPTPVHAYPGPGTYEVSLTTLHEDSCSWTSTITIIIEADCPCPEIYDPVCVISVDGSIIEFDNICFAECAGYGPDHIVPCGGEDCYAEITAIQEDDEGFVWFFEGNTTGNVVSYEWNFGDGNTSTEATPVHTYTTPGVYFISLTIVTVDGCTSTAYHFLYAGNCFNIIIAIPTNNLTYAFGAIATGSPVSYFWEFGDGETSNDPTPVHTYPAAGSYTVSLTTVHEDSCSWTSVKTIQVGEDCVCPDVWDPVCVITDFGDIYQFGNLCEAQCAGYTEDQLVPCNDDCPCPDIYDPVCVISDDGSIISFDNACFAECEGFGPDQFVDCDDDCICTDEWDPVCVLDGDMIIIFSNLCEANCAGYGEDQIVDCENDCQCTEEYDPVCVETCNGEIIQFQNACFAQCEGYGPDQFVDCEEDCICTDEWDPVCVVTDFGDIYQFGNLCEALCAGYTEDQVVPCNNDCPCPEIYDPVCVISDDGTIISFQNACYAECEGFGSDQFVDCEPDCICTDEYDPVCVEIWSGEILQFQNACLAECEGFSPDQFIDCETDCICTDEWDPVCVITEDGAFIMFSNLCEAECAGFGPDQIVDCDGVGDDDGPVDTEPVFHTINSFDLDGFSGNELPELDQQSFSNGQPGITTANLYPNPVSGSQLTIEVEVLASTTAQISIVSITGKVVQDTLVDLSKGKQQIEIELNQMVNGIYFARIETSTATQVLKFMKQE